VEDMIVRHLGPGSTLNSSTFTSTAATTTTVISADTPAAVDDGSGDASDMMNNQNNSNDNNINKQQNLDWKLIILHTSREYTDHYIKPDMQKLIASLERKYPNATIVGGDCCTGYISSASDSRTLNNTSGKVHASEYVEFVNKYRYQNHLHRVGHYNYNNGGIFGVAVSGNISVEAISSIGYASTINDNDGLPQPSTPYYVAESQLHLHDELDETGSLADDELDETGSLAEESHQAIPDNCILSYYYNKNDHHRIRSVLNTQTGLTMSVQEFLKEIQVYPPSAYGGLLFGLRRKNQDGFEVFHQKLIKDDEFLRIYGMTSDASIVGYNFDFLLTNKDTYHINHHELTVQRLQSQLEGEKVIGAIMYCDNNRRLRYRSYIHFKEELKDAHWFHEAFPMVPFVCVGSFNQYGPSVVAGGQATFQTKYSTKLQNAVVYLLFMVPKIGQHAECVDDSEEAMLEFIMNKFQRLHRTAATCNH
jgi:hypothetical protein